MSNNTKLEPAQKQKKDELKQLQKDIKQASKGLNSRQIRFAELMAMGDKSGGECARQAGYATKTAYTKAWKLVRVEQIRLLIEKHSDLNAYTHGMGVAWYRNELQTLLSLAKDKMDIGGGNAVLRTMAELDGLIATGKGNGGKSTTVIKVVALDRSGVVIEHESN